MRRICVVLTARTSYTKIKPIITALEVHPDVELQIVCAASAVLERYGKVERTVVSDGFTISERIYMVLEAENLLTSAKSTGMGLIEFAGAFDRLRPDVVVVMADRYEILAAAIAASYQNIPLAHVQGGEVSGNIDEKVRHAVSKLADMHFPATERARDWLVQMGEDPAAVHWVGCPSIDIAQQVVREPALDFDVYLKYGGVGSRPDLAGGFLIVMQHPVTTEFADASLQVTETLHAVSRAGHPVLWFWPNPDAGGDETAKAIRKFRENNGCEQMHFIKNMEPADFLRLLHNSDGIIGNSSVAIRECSFMGVPAVNVGTRQAHRERGPNVMDVDYDRHQIQHAIDQHLGGRLKGSSIYGTGDAGIRIANVLATAPLTFVKSLTYNTSPDLPADVDLPMPSEAVSG